VPAGCANVGDQPLAFTCGVKRLQFQRSMKLKRRDLAFAQAQHGHAAG